MSDSPSIAERLAAGEPLRFLALTNNCGIHLPQIYYWFDVFAAAIRRQYGGRHRFLNTEYYKNTAIMRAAVPEELQAFPPDVALILIGGTEYDAADQPLGEAATRDNLLAIQQAVAQRGGTAVFMTYYLPDADRLPEAVMGAIERNMDIVREVAAATGSPLIDHFADWSRLKRKLPILYRYLMADPLHATTTGYTLMGLTAANRFGANPPEDLSCELNLVLGLQQLIAQL